MHRSRPLPLLSFISNFLNVLIFYFHSNWLLFPFSHVMLWRSKCMEWSGNNASETWAWVWSSLLLLWLLKLNWIVMLFWILDFGSLYTLPNQVLNLLIRGFLFSKSGNFHRFYDFYVVHTFVLILFGLKLESLLWVRLMLVFKIQSG